MNILGELDMAPALIHSANVSQWPFVVLQGKNSSDIMIKETSVKQLTEHIQLETRFGFILL